jgi:BolA protein
MNTPDLMRERLQALAPHSIDILDDSSQHAGHAGAASGGGHYRLLLVSARFHGLSLPARHRMVYDALGSLMGTAIHALSIRALTPDEI